MHEECVDVLNAPFQNHM